MSASLTPPPYCQPSHMPQYSDDTLTLYELNQLVADILRIGMPDSYWVEAEIAEMREVRGHCFMDLIQKDDGTNTPIARASAKCWASQWLRIKSDFKAATGQRLTTGMKVLLKVHADFHEAYGFAWIVTGINPDYSIGNLARRRKEIIARLRDEGVLELQKELRLSAFAQRIAVVSSSSAAGYDDFQHQLLYNPQRLAFSTRLFPATMQGENVEQSIIAALNAINSQSDSFDAVVIIRGGGATSDLSGFDTLPLAENVANFPLPIITGIGHNRDESVLDIVAFRSVKTPTAAATMLVDNLTATARRIDRAQEQLTKYATRAIDIEKMRIASLSSRFVAVSSSVAVKRSALLESLTGRLSALSRGILHDKKLYVEQIEMQIAKATARFITSERHKLDLLEQRAGAADPATLLRRGYSLTIKDGVAVSDVSAISPGDTITTMLANGSFESVVKQKKDKV